ncbi:MAG: hypothetical protein GX881_00455, partial [Firmicutes bacterium]|nr:hypothetical protein [Bacillota bacterium]
VERSLKEKRSREMIALGRRMADDFRRKFIATTQEVLVEKVRPYQFGEGFTPHYLRARVALEGRGKGWPGRIVTVRLEKIEGQYLLGKT